MATIEFLTDNVSLGGSGLGFFGAGGWAASVAVGEFADNVYITDSNGVTQGPQGNCVKKIHANSGEIPTSVQLNLLDLPNNLSTLEIKFTNGAAVQCQNAQVVLYDRNDTGNAPSGVSCFCAEIAHPSTSQSGSLGSGDSAWLNIAATAVLDLFDSPGESGLHAGDNGGASTYSSTEHSWFIAISPSPDSVGSKTSFGLYFQTEFL